MGRIGTVREIWRYPAKSMQGEQLDACAVNLNGIHEDRGWALRDETTQEITGARRLPMLLQCTARYRADATSRGVRHVDIMLPDGTSVGSDAADVNARLSSFLGKPVSLWPIQPSTNKAHYRRAQPGAAVIGFLGRSRTMRRAIQGMMKASGMDADVRTEMSREPGEPLPDMADFTAELLEFATSPGTYFDAFPIHFVTTASLAEMARLNPSPLWNVRRFRPNILIETTQGMTGLVESGWGGRTLQIGAVRLKCEMPTVRCGMTTHAQPDLPKDPSVLRTIVRDANQNLGTYASVAATGSIRIGDDVVIT